MVKRNNLNGIQMHMTLSLKLDAKFLHILKIEPFLCCPKRRQRNTYSAPFLIQFLSLHIQEVDFGGGLTPPVVHQREKHGDFTHRT